MSTLEGFAMTIKKNAINNSLARSYLYSSKPFKLWKLINLFFLL